MFSGDTVNPPQEVLTHSSAPPLTAVLPVAPTNSTGVSSRGVFPPRPCAFTPLRMQFAVAST